MVLLGLLSLALAAPTAAGSSEAAPNDAANARRMVQRSWGESRLEKRASRLMDRKVMENLSNAERIARGLPLRKPRQVYDHTLGARAPQPSGARKRDAPTM
ncbi:hypothetical protein IAU60_003818 [Kwoniella sp. DSM 27419]